MYWNGHWKKPPVHTFRVLTGEAIAALQAQTTQPLTVATVAQTTATSI